MIVEERFRLAADDEDARLAAEVLFVRIRDQIAPRMPASADIRHVGATAVPGCATKGDLDVVVRVAACDFDAAEAEPAALFPRNSGSIRTVDFAAFADETQSPSLGIQLTVREGRFDVFHGLVDALRADPELVTRYNTLKARFDGQPMDAYRAAKARFIETILADARVGKAL
ncbi:GrpB family protein [Methylobacterium sp. 10]|uniref:GrpB family protein n=1 Tax=Methylobacterium sp. 10 TaxID=1101191 RepID=UPI000489A3E0|nr:GrpB family protein [Methylobacterium sp. 10]